MMSGIFPCRDFGPPPDIPLLPPPHKNGPRGSVKGAHGTTAGRLFREGPIHRSPVVWMAIRVLAPCKRAGNLRSLTTVPAQGEERHHPPEAQGPSPR